MLEEDVITGHEIKSYEDLEAVAMECYEDMRRLVRSRILNHPKVTLESLIANIEALKSHVYSLDKKR